ncbi:hypothetical protein L1887_30153 [Cichorium endivia]|nr:hypothetical protein L1887_30153 [Cichorium endivia]
MASYRFLYCAVFFGLLVTASSTFSSSISYKMLESHATTGLPVPPLKPCPADFEHKIYTVMTSNCRGPHYKTELCCNALEDIACSHVNGLNDLTGDCIIINSDYLGYHGNYATGLFAKLCSNGEKGLTSTLADLLFSSITTPQALADTNPPRPPQTPLQAELVKQNPSTNSLPFSQSNVLTAPKPQANSDLPEGSQWRYNEFLNAVKKGKVERVRFNKDGGVLQLTAVDGRRASVVVPNDPDLIDILAMNGVDISVSEDEGDIASIIVSE